MGQWCFGHFTTAAALFITLCSATPSVPVATNAILSTATIPTVSLSFVTIYSVVPATDAAPITPVTTTIDGQVTTLLSTDVIAGSITETSISTVSLTTTEVIVQTIGYSTVLGPDPSTQVSASSSSLVSTPIVLVSSTIQTPIFSTSISSAFPSSQITTSNTATTTSSTHSSTTSVAGVSNDASGTTSHKSALSKGAKAGIAIGVIIGVALLAAIFFLLGQWASRRRNNSPQVGHEAAMADHRQSFRAGQPYEATVVGHGSPVTSDGKGYPHSTVTTAVSNKSRSVSGESNEKRLSHPAYDQHDPATLSALPQVADDETIHVGVPAHFSGEKRWSGRRYMK